MIPFRTPFFLPLIFPSLTWRKNSQEKELYLTFDDGPVSGPTDFVLEYLAKESIHATFFCIGDNLRKHPELFDRVASGGHSVGNHTFNHLNGWTTKPEDYVTNVHRCQEIINSTNAKIEQKLFRPPYGRITGKQIKALAGYQIIMWDVLSQDYDQRLSPEQCLRGTLKACRAGSIIVFHDSYKAEKNMQYVLPRLIDHVRNEGYAFKCL